MAIPAESRWLMADGYKKRSSLVMKSVITVFSIITLCFSVSAWGLNDDDALMLYFTFDEDEGGKVTDVSGNNIEGTFEGAVWSKDGKFGGCCLS